MRTLIIFLLLCSTAHASTPYSAEALEWWLRQQGKWEHATVRTEMIRGEWEITTWGVKDVKKPTDVEVLQIISDYNTIAIKKKTLEERIEILEQLNP